MKMQDLLFDLPWILCYIGRESSFFHHFIRQQHECGMSDTSVDAALTRIFPLDYRGFAAQQQKSMTSQETMRRDHPGFGRIGVFQDKLNEYR